MKPLTEADLLGMMMKDGYVTLDSKEQYAILNATGLAAAIQKQAMELRAKILAKKSETISPEIAAPEPPIGPLFP